MLSLRNTGKDPSAGLSNIRPGDQNWSDKDFNFFLFFFFTIDPQVKTKLHFFHLSGADRFI